jgi:hypothetical protein
MAPPSSRSAAKTSAYMSITQDSWVWLAWVSRAIDGIATLREATAETTVARARHVTSRTARCAELLVGAVVGMSASCWLGWDGSGLGPRPWWER